MWRIAGILLFVGPPALSTQRRSALIRRWWGVWYGCRVARIEIGAPPPCYGPDVVAACDRIARSGPKTNAVLIVITYRHSGCWVSCWCVGWPLAVLAACFRPCGAPNIKMEGIDAHQTISLFENCFPFLFIPIVLLFGCLFLSFCFVLFVHLSFALPSYPTLPSIQLAPPTSF